MSKFKINGVDIIRPSKLELIKACPGYCRTRSLVNMESTSTIAADTGTLLHSALPLLYNNKLTLEDATEKYGIDNTAILKEALLLTKEVVMEHDAVLFEKKMSYKPLDLEGTADAVIIDSNRRVIIDYKFGQSYVPPPTYNLQIKAYCLMLHHMVGGAVMGCIIQPQAHEQLRSFIFWPDAFQKIEAEIKEVIECAEKEDAPLCRGEHCKTFFCDMLNFGCQEWHNNILEIPRHDNMIGYFTSLTEENRSRLWEKLVDMESYIKKTKETLQEFIIKNNVPMADHIVSPGYNKYICSNLDEAIEKLKPLLAEKKLPKPKELLSKSALEKLLGKNETIDNCFTIVAGNPIIKRRKP